MERRTVELSFIAMAGCWQTDPAKVVGAVKDLMAEMQPRLEIVWGPAVHQPNPDLPGPQANKTDALALVCRDLDTGEYYAIFRGTNTVSAVEWLLQDFQVMRQVPWTQIAPGGGAPADALVSEGAELGVRLRLGLVPEAGVAGEGTRLDDFLIGLVDGPKDECALHFTGHSLGGLLAPAVALWLMDDLVSSGRGELASRLALDVYSYAAPSAGNGAFADYLCSRLPGLRRYANPIDIATLAWDDSSIASLPDLYKPLAPMQPITRSLYDLCRALARGKGYAQPGGSVSVPAKVVPVQGGLYLLEAAYQHSMPYLDMLEGDRSARIVREVLLPLASSVKTIGPSPIDFTDLFVVPK
jgi:hypothetical protein